MRRLIVTADDVGLHRGMTLGAIKAHREGIVTACSIVANGKYFDHAIEELAGCPGLDVGIHLALVEESPVLPGKSVPSLIGRGGKFVRSFHDFLQRYYIGAIKPAELEAELRAQCEKVFSAGIKATHLNGHQHLHVLPNVLEVVLKLAREYGIRYVRSPQDLFRRSSVSFIRSFSVAALNKFGGKAHEKMIAAGIVTNERTIGIARSGHLTPDSLADLLAHVENLTELVAHPGVGQINLSASYDWGYAWEEETAALCDPSLRTQLAARAVTLCSVRDAVGDPSYGRS